MSSQERYHEAEQGRQTEQQARVIPLRPRPRSERPAPQRPAPVRTTAVPTPVSTPVPTPVTPAAKEPLWRDVVGDVLRRERLAQERTLKDVAEAARISMPYLSELERGRKEASSEVLAAGARALGLSLADLLSLAQTELIRHASPQPTRTSPRQGDIRLAA
ncbi:helix-turn-helix domain-containing protein [Streptomyces sp. NPDC054864]